MATDLQGFTTQEVLNKVLNTTSESFKVDIVSGAEYAEDSGHTTADTGSFVLGVRNDTLGTLGDASGDYVPFQMNASGALYVEIASGGSADAAHVDDAVFTLGTHSGMMMMGFAGTQSVDANDAGAIAMETDGSVHIHDGGNTITVDGTVDLGTTDNAVLDAIAASLAIVDDWDDSNYANVNLNIAGSDIAANAGTMSATTPRVTIATDDTHFGAVGAAADVDGVVHGQLRYIGAGVDTLETTLSNIETAIQIIDDWDDSNYANVNINIAGTDVDGNSGNKSAQSQRVVIATDDVNVSAIKTAVELIDDTVAVLGTATYSETSTKGNVVGVVRNDTLAALAGTDNEIAPLQVNKSGALYTVEETGQLGSIFENATTAYSSKQIIAIQFLEDTKFTTLTTDSTIFPGTHADDNGIQIDNNDVFPQGMTIFGKWTAFTLASGSVIAYQGAW